MLLMCTCRRIQVLRWFQYEAIDKGIERKRLEVLSKRVKVKSTIYINIYPASLSPTILCSNPTPIILVLLTLSQIRLYNCSFTRLWKCSHKVGVEGSKS